MSARESSSAGVPPEDTGQFTRWRGLLSVTLSVLLGPITALANQQVIYAVNMWACGHQAHGSMHIVPLLSLIVIGGATLGAYLNWRAVGRGTADEDGTVIARTRFLALLGMAIGVFSAVVVLAQWFAIFMFDPCMRA